VGWWRSPWHSGSRRRARPSLRNNRPSPRSAMCCETPPPSRTTSQRPFFDHVYVVADVALIEIVSPASNAGVRLRTHAATLICTRSGENTSANQPIERNANLAVEAGHLHQINPAPQAATP